MTDREKEIRDAERKAIAEVRSWRRKAAKQMSKLSPEEQEKYWENLSKELRARGINVGPSLR
jgi:hypothetical protein